jgi:hypothetical protein
MSMSPQLVSQLVHIVFFSGGGGVGLGLSEGVGGPVFNVRISGVDITTFSQLVSQLVHIVFFSGGGGVGLGLSEGVGGPVFNVRMSGVDITTFAQLFPILFPLWKGGGIQ